MTAFSPLQDFGGAGNKIVFVHANGYPPACYQPLFESLKKQYRVSAMLLRPLWESARMEDLRDWHPLSEDLLRTLPNSAGNPVIGVGHSVGGIVALRAALKEPQKFRALILLDPVLFVPPFLLMWNFVRAIGMGNRVHPKIQGALKRRRTFDHLDTVFRGYRSRSVFKYFSDESLRAYIEGITRQKEDGGYELVYSPEWEARIYLTGLRDFDLWRNLPKLKPPTLIIRGAETDTLTEKAVKLAIKKNPNIQIQTLEKSTHLLPLEYPQRVSESINSFLENIHPEDANHKETE